MFKIGIQIHLDSKHEVPIVNRNTLSLFLHISRVFLAPANTYETLLNLT